MYDSDLYIVRGCPGFGKSTYAKKLLELLVPGWEDFEQNPGSYKESISVGFHFEADMFFEKNGLYQFDISKLHQAHEWCLNSTKKALLSNNSTVVVSNTFTTMKEMRPYVDFSKKYDISLTVYRMTHEYGSIHNVPPETIEKMKARFQDFEGELLVEDLS